MNIKYWFYIENYVHVEIKPHAALLYNPYRKKILEYTHPTILALLHKLRQGRNMGVISLDDHALEDAVLKNFVDEARTHFMGDLMEKRFSKGKPILMTPIVKVEKDIDMMKKDSERSIGENIMSYISTVSIYINSLCLFRCESCEDAYRQVMCCTMEDHPRELEWERLRGFLSQVAHTPLTGINILGGDLTRYSALKPLIERLNMFKCRKTFWLNYLHITSAKPLRELGINNSDNNRLNMLISLPFYSHKHRFEKAIDILRTGNFQFKTVFLIHNTPEYEEAEKLVSQYGFEDVEFFPVYNVLNENFFRENVFLSKADIEAIGPSLNEIYMNSSINPVDFGKLTVMADGKVYANVNEKPIGELGSESVYDMVVGELGSTKSWRKTRREVKPCKMCTYRFLCPAISNYNRVMKRYNFCTIYEEKQV